MKNRVQRQDSTYKMFLVSSALVLSCSFLFLEWKNPATHQEKIGTGHAWLGQAYNFYKYGISNVVGNVSIRSASFRMYDKAMLPPQFNTVSIYDPIFYSAFCASLWRILGAPSWWPLKILNIILFSFLTILLFKALSILFVDKKKALVSTFGVLMFFPLAYTNLAIPRDVHHYYFFVIFLYFALTYIFQKKSIGFLFLGALGIVFCQWVRPPILSSFVVLSLLIILWGQIESKYKEKMYASLSVFWLTSIFLFWIPFCLFNKITYNKYFLSALGENMLSSLYGVPYPDGDVQEHSVGQFVERKVGHKMNCGSIESDNVCMNLYKEYATRYPFHILKCMLIRVRQMLWYDLSWRNYNPYKVTTSTSRWFKLKLALTSPSMFFEFFARIYIRLLLVFGYIGMIIAYYRREYKILIFMIFGVILSSGYSWLFHIEDRVLAVHNWPFGLFAGYFLSFCYEFLILFIKNKNRIQNFKFFMPY